MEDERRIGCDSFGEAAARLGEAVKPSWPVLEIASQKAMIGVGELIKRLAQDQRGGGRAGCAVFMVGGAIIVGSYVNAVRIGVLNDGFLLGLVIGGATMAVGAVAAMVPSDRW